MGSGDECYHISNVLLVFTIGPMSNWKFTGVEPSALHTFDSFLYTSMVRQTKNADRHFQIL